MNLDKNYAGLKPAMLNFTCTQDMHGVSRIKILRLSNTMKYNVTTPAQVVSSFFRFFPISMYRNLEYLTQLIFPRL